jgi:hypothetical protein
MQTREWNQVDSELAKIRIQLTREAKAASNARKRSTYEVVKVTIGWGGKLESPEADVVQSFIVKNHALVGVLDKLVDRKCGVVGLDNCVGHLGRRENRERQHDTVWVLLSDLRNQ